MTPNKISVFVFIILWPAVIMAQESTPSPYSYFGIGDIHYGDISCIPGMASTTISLSGRALLNTSNPASLSALDSNLFILDMSGSLKGSRFSTGSDVRNAISANFTGLTAGLHISPRWSSAMSLQPYSSVSYLIGYDEFVEGTQLSAPTLYSGTGGVTRFSFLNSFFISGSLSFGADIMMLLGAIDRDVTRSGLTISQSSTAMKFSFTAGLQYREEIRDDLSLSVGAVYGHSCDLDFENNLVVTDASGNILLNDAIASSSIDIPRSYGAGISLSGRRFTLATDYRYQRWSLSKEQYPGFCLTDTHRFSTGIMFTPARYASDRFLNKLFYQAGLAVSNSYLTINGINPVKYEVSTGAGVPYRNGSQINMGLSLGRLGTTAEGLVSENYFKLVLSFSLAERMFFRRMYE